MFIFKLIWIMGVWDINGNERSERIKLLQNL